MDSSVGLHLRPLGLMLGQPAPPANAITAPKWRALYVRRFAGSGVGNAPKRHAVAARNAAQSPRAPYCHSLAPGL